MALRKEKILIVDDSYEMLELIQRYLIKRNYLTYKASSVVEAIEVLKHNSIDLLITDLYMPELSGIDLLKYTAEHFPMLSNLAITGMPSIANAINALKSGAIDYLAKPFTAEEFYMAVENSLLKTKNNQILSSESKLPLSEENNYAGIIGYSKQFKKLIDTINRVKNNTANVLIEGESGTSKELIARAIHYQGSRAKMPFITINCGGIPESLMESELFGHVKGAFTGAAESKIGLFQAAHTGTIFLDEIGNAPMLIQTRLLKVLQEKEITKIGATISEKIDIRIIAATNNDLYQMISKGTFREDLYYRLNVVSIKTAPLRDRKEDILPLAKYFITKYCMEYNKPEVVIDNKASEILLRYKWPGNIRELENIIQRMIIMSDDTISIEDIPEHLKYHFSENIGSLKSLKEFEKEQILKILNAVGNNKTKAAKILQIDRKTLNQKLIN